MLKGCNPVGVKGANTENPRLGIPTLPATPRQAPVGSRLGGSPLPSAEAPPGPGWPFRLLVALLPLQLPLWSLSLFGVSFKPPSQNCPIGEQECPVAKRGAGYKKCICKS